VIKTQLSDASTGSSPRILDESLVVTQFTCPPLLPQKNKIFRQYLTDDGTSSGSNDMLVDGSSTNQKFWVEAHDNDDRYITMVSFVIGDGGAALNEFGNATALTNGCLFEYERSGETVTIHEGLKSNWDFVRMCCLNPSFGDAASAFRGTNIEGGAEAYAPVMDFTKIIPPYGVKLDAGSNQRLMLTIRDDCTVPDVFNAIAYGFDRFE
jgi:hypothetical protein